MRRVNMALEYIRGEEIGILNKAIALYEQWEKKHSSSEDELLIDICPVRD